MAIEAVIFDIGGVLVRTVDWSFRRRWEQQLGLPEGGLSALVFDTEQAMLASTGKAVDKLIWQHVSSQLRLTDAELTALHTDFWTGDAANLEMIAYLQGLRHRFKTGILSNAWPEMRTLNENQFGLRGVVDSALYSFQIGYLKPVPATYEAILSQLTVAPQNAVFIDDSIVNIGGAQRLGMQTVHFLQTEQAITELQAILVP